MNVPEFNLTPAESRVLYQGDRCTFSFSLPGTVGDFDVNYCVKRNRSDSNSQALIFMTPTVTQGTAVEGQPMLDIVVTVTTAMTRAMKGRFVHEFCINTGGNYTTIWQGTIEFQARVLGIPA